MMKSPLLFPVELKDNKILVLDETALPFKEEYIEVFDLDKALWVWKEMKTRSLGQVLLFFYCCILFKDSLSCDEMSEKFKAKRPTFDFSMLAKIIEEQVKRGLSIEEAVNNFVLGFDALRRKRAQRLAKALPDACGIATICNVNGELIYLYEELKDLGKRAFFYVSETRPYLQGTRLTFWELRKNNIPCKVICDSQIAYLMKQEKIKAVVVGADRATLKGDIINKIGTYALSRLAKHFNIPFYALTQYPRDIDIDSIEMEEREAQEAFMYLSQDHSQIDAVYPAFDITKQEFITQSLELGSVHEARCA
jgi:methylthioribose-1-phosphate isomerase